MKSGEAEASPSGRRRRPPPTTMGGMSVHLTLPSSVRRRFERLSGDARRVFAERFVAVVATSLTHSVVFAADIRPGDLDALGALVETWHREDLETPLVMTPDEFRRSLDVFPVEYQGIIDRHVVIAGDPPFAGAVVPGAALRRACEVQAKGHLIHLRQGWLEGGGNPDELGELAVHSAPALRRLLTNVARLSGQAPPDGDPAMHGARLAGLPEALVQAVLDLEDAPDGRRAVAARMADYVAAAERLWAFIDGWQA